jgi:replicative DNA helicase
LEDLPLDVFVLQEELINIPYKETQWRFVEDYIKTIKNEGIKDEIAKFVSSHFSREISEVRKMFQVACSDNTETILQDFKTIDIALQDYKELLSRGTISTGFATIDESINKVRKSEIMFLAAYAGVLKTFLAVKMALHMAFKQNKNVIFFSMEMSAGALAERMVANILGISTREVERRVIEGDEIINKIKGAIDEKIYIVDKNSLGLKEIRNYIEIAATRKFDAPVDCVFIDYLQYMKGTSSYEDISETAKGFKPIAKEMNLSFIILSQLNRGGSQWQRPDIGQLRGSGDIEATGDFVLGIWRPEFNPTITLEQRIELKNQIQLAILKARRGYVGPGEFSFRFLPEKTDIIEE